MLKDEFNSEPQLKNSLDEYEIEVPKQLTHFKKSRWQRLIHYLASPTKDPLEPICSSSIGYTSLKVIPIVTAIFITIIQLLIQ